MVRVFARQHCVRLKCSVVQQRSDAKPWLAAVAAVAYCRRCINAGTRRACKPLQLLQALIFAVENPRPAIFAVLHNFAAHTTRIGDAAPFYVISQLSRTSAGHRSRSPGSAHGR